MECDYKLEVKLDKPKIDFVNGGLIYSVMVSCGRCYNCKQNRANQWSFRLVEEMKQSQSAYFVTLTYQEPPMTNKGFMTLDKKHVQDFMKRLRKIDKAPPRTSIETLMAARRGQLMDYRPIRFFAAGEYGSRRKRPHYHLIIFNVRDKSSIEDAWKSGEYYKVRKKGEVIINGEKQIHSWLDEQRSYFAGSIHIDKCNINTIDYTVKYLAKEQTANLFKGFDGQKEFNLQSKNLGISYLRQDVVKFHRKNKEQNALNTQRGFKIPIPKYYREKIYECTNPVIYEDGKTGNCGVCESCIARWQSISYIKNEVEKKEQKDIKKADREGRNYDLTKQQQKEARKNKLKNQLKSRDID